MIHLRDKDRETICRLAKEAFSQPVELWAYGSRIDGTSHEASDLDLVIRGPGLKKLEVLELAEFKDSLQNSHIPIVVQVFDWARLPESFHQNILKKYEVLSFKIHT